MDARHSDRDAQRQEGAALTPRLGRSDAIIAALLFVVAAWVGSEYVRFVIAAGGKPRFYQVELAPAVMSACDRGYVNPDLNALPELKRFLDLELNAFACGTLPTEVATVPLSNMQRAFQYQEFAIASTWRWAGVSWTGLAVLCGVLFGITTVAAYGLFRTAAGRTLAILGSVALVGSTLQLIHLPNLRDYSKGPFLVAAACCLAWLARTTFSPRALVAIGAGYGVLIGLGMGFRNDLLIALPPFIATLFLFLPGRLRDGLGVKLAAVAACILAFWVTMAPMRAIYAPGGGNSMQHVLLLGLGDSFNADLGVTNDGLYSWGNAFTDEYVHVQTSSYATRMWGVTHALELYGPEYRSRGQRTAGHHHHAISRGYARARPRRGASNSRASVQHHFARAADAGDGSRRDSRIQGARSRASPAGSRLATSDRRRAARARRLQSAACDLLRADGVLLRRLPGVAVQRAALLSPRGDRVVGAAAGGATTPRVHTGGPFRNRGVLANGLARARVDRTCATRCRSGDRHCGPDSGATGCAQTVSIGCRERPDGLVRYNSKKSRCGGPAPQVAKVWFGCRRQTCILEPRNPSPCRAASWLPNSPRALVTR